MRVAVNTLFLIPEQVGGTEVYVRSLLPSLLELDPALELIVITNRENHASFSDFDRRLIDVRATSRPRRVWAEQMLLPRTARQAGVPLRIVESVIEINADRKKNMARRVIARCGGSVEGKTIAILGLAFKPNTDDMRDAPSLDIVPALQAAGATVRAYDPEGMEEAKKLMNGIEYCEGAYETMTGADALVILTEWNAFRALDFARVKAALKVPVLIDLRNIYDPAEMLAAGFDYSCIGRPSQTTETRHDA